MLHVHNKEEANSSSFYVAATEDRAAQVEGISVSESVGARRECAQFFQADSTTIVEGIDVIARGSCASAYRIRRDQERRWQRYQPELPFAPSDSTSTSDHR
jgi:hypothetical protein